MVLGPERLKSDSKGPSTLTVFDAIACDFHCDFTAIKLRFCRYERRAQEVSIQGDLFWDYFEME